jgi:RNA polymerase sigma-70 factor (ECF subfamily)
VLLHGMLLHLAPSPVTRLHRATAVRYTSGSQAAITELDALAEPRKGYHLYHATQRRVPAPAPPPRAGHRSRPPRPGVDREPAEQAVLQQRLNWA